MANAYKKHPSSKLGGLDLKEWNITCLKGGLLFWLIFALIGGFIVAILYTIASMGISDEAYNAFTDEILIWFVYSSWGIFSIFALIGWFISQMQSDHYLCLQEDNIIGKASNGIEFDLAYTEIRSVQVKDFDDYNFLVRILGRFIPFIRHRETLIIRHSGGVIKYVYECSAEFIANKIEEKIKQINQQNQQQNTNQNNQQNTNQNNQQNTYQNNQQNTNHNNQQNPPSASGIRR